MEDHGILNHPSQQNNKSIYFLIRHNMDFYDPVTEAGAGAESKEESKPAAPVDEKTNELVNELENKVEDIYQNIEKTTKSGWSSMNGFLSNFQKHLPEYYTNLEQTIKTNQTDLTKKLNENKENLAKATQQVISKENSEKLKENSEKLIKNVTVKTNEYLDELDEDLEKIENLSLEYASKLGGFLKKQTGVASKSFWGIINDNLQISADSSSNVKSAKLGSDASDILFNLPSGLTSNRLEAQLLELQNNKELYVTPSDDILKSAKDLKLTPEQVKEKNTVLESKESKFYKLFTELTTASSGEAEGEAKAAAVDADIFWAIYFISKEKIVEQEKKRQELLQQHTETNDDEEFDWDDDEEEEEEKPKKEESKTSTATGTSLSSPVTPDKKASDEEDWE